MDNSKRTPCAVYCRVMGYLRPVSHYNIGKKSEFYSRTYFKADKIIDNEAFIKKYQKELMKVDNINTR